mmetsp:Transcript_16317/g.31663  ORF Transcript_16317/g.31663 Transcript_16317/m.31663 type:complete len:450 (-) Transcript_16317:278-1627(-)|eukprot:CAMPEP_0171510204 /NCGR_PEP_ID=MMETSP0959-20130129/230_1 /TAXON_ID=87120 /ORGANISM="Aurantiochytrium limacinum, Strain ATCCMYA-1381" /LENGTH=449 /DNA_ID=CAMNT_0012047535 /DNA_START=615 /DNA_END=1964 /DNA_ORIENTATION=+
MARPLENFDDEGLLGLALFLLTPGPSSEVRRRSLVLTRRVSRNRQNAYLPQQVAVGSKNHLDNVRVLPGNELRRLDVQLLDLELEFYFDEVYVVQADRAVYSMAKGAIVRQRELHCIGSTRQSLTRAVALGEKMKEAYEKCEDDLLKETQTLIHAEVMANESPQFTEYFKNLTNYLVYYYGPRSKGFRLLRSASKYKSRLLKISQVQIDHNARLRVTRACEVPRDYHLLNAHSVFVLDCGLEAYSYDRVQNSWSMNAIRGLTQSIAKTRSNLRVEKINPGAAGSAPKSLFWTTLGGSWDAAIELESERQDAEDNQNLNDMRWGEPRGSVSGESHLLSQWQVEGIEDLLDAANSDDPRAAIDASAHGLALKFDSADKNIHLDEDVYVVDEGTGHLFIYHNARDLLTSLQAMEIACQYSDFQQYPQDILSFTHLANQSLVCESFEDCFSRR